MFREIILLFSLSIIAFACSQNKVYDEYVELDNSVWHVDSLATFDFDIKSDTSIYNLSYNVRYIDVYPYYNIYIKYYLEDSIGNIISSDPQEILLFDRKTGRPLGDGLGDIFDREVLIFKDYQFPYQGPFTFKVKQYMRVQNLPGIMSFGLKIENKELQ